MKEYRVKCRILTPLIMSGADSYKVELREPSIKGMLRWWYRFWKGPHTSSLDELKKKESNIWGSQDNASRLRLKITSRLSESDTETAFLCMNVRRKKEGDVPKAYNHIKRKSFSPSKIFDLSFFYLPQQENIVIDDLKKTLWLISSLGGLGARWRRGFGSISIDELEKHGENYYGLEGDNLKQIAEKMSSRLQGYKGDNNSLKFMHLGNTHIYLMKPKKDFWHSWNGAMNELWDKFYRPFKKEKGISAIGGAKPRRASPMIIQIKKTTHSNNYFGIVLSQDDPEYDVYYKKTELERFINTSLFFESIKLI
ncbi:MAG: type III-B CRISPR module RAMP protein Cmr1 [Tepidanaerobacteraceae bacterium]|nr:type III-B CRISPR module RAMP protein Cmr1 [Tepidanaerobacteraceae bacterium]